MILENRYGLSTEQVQRLVNDGFIHCSVKNYVDIYDHVQRFKTECPTCSMHDLFRKVEDATKIDFDRVKHAYYKIVKIL